MKLQREQNCQSCRCQPKEIRCWPCKCRVNISELQRGRQKVLCDLRWLVRIRLNGNLGQMLIQGNLNLGDDGIQRVNGLQGWQLMESNDHIWINAGKGRNLQRKSIKSQGWNKHILYGHGDELGPQWRDCEKLPVWRCTPLPALYHISQCCTLQQSFQPEQLPGQLSIPASPSAPVTIGANNNLFGSNTLVFHFFIWLCFNTLICTS